MLILQIDSSSELCSVALSHDGSLLEMEKNDVPFQHGRDINILIGNLMERCTIGFSELSAVSVNKGPGSYTALRIGMATAKGLCYGRNIPLIAPTGMEILIDYAMENYPGMDYYVPMIDARRMEVYSVDPIRDLSHDLAYNATILREESYSSIRDSRVCFIGNGVEKWKAIWQEKFPWTGVHLEIDAGMMSRISHQYLMENNISNLFITAPLYIKKPNITKSKKEYFN